MSNLLKQQTSISYSSNGELDVVHSGVAIQVRKVKGLDGLQLKTNDLRVASYLLEIMLRKIYVTNDLGQEQIASIVNVILHCHSPVDMIDKADRRVSTACYKLQIDEELFKLLSRSLSIENDQLVLAINGKSIL